MIDSHFYQTQALKVISLDTLFAQGIVQDTIKIQDTRKIQAKQSHSMTL